MTPWTVVVEIDPDVEDAARTAALGVVIKLIDGAHATIAHRSAGTLVALATGRETADRLAAAARETPAVTAAYVKPPDALP